MKNKNKKIISTLIGITYFSTLALFASAPISGQRIKSKTLTATAGKVTSQAYNFNSVKAIGTGYVPAVIFNKTEKDLIYARTDMGGAYRWNVKTSTWIPLTDWVGFDDWNMLGCESIATDPIDTNRVYIAAGTYTNSWAGNGYILRSTDKGNTWQKTALPFKLGGNMPGRGMGERLNIDPNNNAILYLGARSGNGLWKSEDYGVTWAQVKSFPNVGNYVMDPTYEYTADNVGVVWTSFDESTGSKGNTTQSIYVGVADKDNSIYHSSDGGKTWSRLEGQPTGYLPHHGVMASTGMLYISYSDTCGPYDGAKGAIWKYDTKNNKWTNITPSVSTVDNQGNDLYYGFGGITVDAQHPDTIMATRIVSWWPDTNIYRSNDGGNTWTAIWKFAGYPDRDLKYTQDISKSPWLDWSEMKNAPEVSPKLGWMTDDIEIDPFNSDRMFYGTGATLYGTDNLTNWDSGGKIKISVMADGIEESAVNGIIAPPTGATLLTALGDVSGFRYTDLTKAPTKLFTNASFSTSSIDYAELKPGFVVRVGNYDKAKKDVKLSSFSYDNGVNWFSGNNNLAEGVGGGTVAAAADASAVVWAPSDADVYYSTNNGNAWTKSTGISKGVKVASDRVNPKKFYGFGSGKFYTSVDGGKTFTQTAATGLPTTGTNNFKAIPGIEGDIWLTGGSETKDVYGLWHSTNSGATFTKVSGVEEADTIGFGKAAPGQNYMALYSSAQVNGVRGIFRSDDEGKSWIRINDNAHQYGCTNTCITGDPNIYGRVYFGTNGRGVIYGDIVQTPITVGDLNGDTKIDTTDYVLLKKYLINPTRSTLDSEAKKAADVNGDGKINVLDYLMMNRFINKKITKFPAQK